MSSLNNFLVSYETTPHMCDYYLLRFPGDSCSPVNLRREQHNLDKIATESFVGGNCSDISPEQHIKNRLSQN